MFSIGFGQSKKLDTIRKQGYLIIKDNLMKNSDIPREYLFIPLEKMQDSKILFEKILGSLTSEIFLISPFIEDISSSTVFNVALSKATDYNYVFKKKSIKASEIFNKINSTCYVDGYNYRVMFLDGIWINTRIKKRYSNYFSEHYNLKTLDPNLDEYMFNFLIGIKSYSINLIFEDN